MARLAGAVLIVVVLLIWLARRSDDSSVAATSRERQATRASIPPRPVAEARSLANADERRVIADRIAAARAARAARASVDPRPAAQLRATNVEAITAELRDALRPVMPAVHGCYERALPDLGDPNVHVEVHLTLTGDPDVGTLIDADVVLDPKRRLPGAMVDCLRSELQLVELPPLASGDALTIPYPFAFGPEPRSL